MGRPKNPELSVEVRFMTTLQVRAGLRRLAKTGFWGKNATEVAERIVSAHLRKLIDARKLILPDPDTEPEFYQ